MLNEAELRPNPARLIEEWRSWLLGERSLSKATAFIYTWRMGYLFRLTDKHPLDITTADLRQHMLATCPKANTKNAALRAFRSFFGFLESEGYREDDPSKPIRRPKVPNTLPK